MTTTSSPVTAKQIEIIRFIQGDLPLTSRPFAELAEKLGISEEEIIDQIKAMKQAGVIRRFGMAVRHQNLGYTANGMSCWNVPAEQVEQVAQVMVTRDELSHCYERPRFPGWKYNMYGMIHGKTPDEVHAVAKAISLETGQNDYDVLFSQREFKRTSMSYFVEED
jgi:siroheme decarboxylase